jgi:TonB dependent receptor-like, beta-barrel
MALATGSDTKNMDLDLSFRTSFHRLSISWMRASDNFRFKLQPHLGYDYFTIGAGTVFLDSSLVQAGTRGELTWTPNKWFRATLGVDGGYGRNTFAGEIPTFQDYYIPGSSISGAGREGPPDETQRIERTGNYGLVGGFLELSFKPFDSLEILPGVRVDSEYHPGGNNWWLDPRIVARWKVAKRVTLKGGTGLFSRGPDFNMVDEEYGNPDLKKEWADQYSVGLEWDIWGPIFIDTQVYYLSRHDRAVFVNATSLSGQGNNRTLYDNQGRGRSYGWETILKYRPEGPFYGWVSYTLSKSEESDAPEDPLTLNAFDQTHILSVVASYRFGRGWEAGLKYRYVTGAPTTPITGAVYVSEGNEFSPLMGSLLSSRVGDFQQLDVRVEKTWTFESWMFSTYLDIQNVTNHSNSEFLIWDYRYEDNWKVPSIPFFPSFGISARW